MSDRQPGREAPSTAHAGDTDDPPTDERRFTQAELDQHIKDRLERQRRALETQKREEQQALEVQKLEETGEHQKLAQQRAKEIEQLKPRAVLAERYEKSVGEFVAEVSATLPSGIQTLLNKLSVPDQMDWLKENFKSMSAPPITTASSNINAWSRGNGGGNQQLSDEEFLAKKRREMNL